MTSVGEERVFLSAISITCFCCFCYVSDMLLYVQSTSYAVVVIQMGKLL